MDNKKIEALIEARAVELLADNKAIADALERETERRVQARLVEERAKAKPLSRMTSTEKTEYIRTHGEDAFRELVRQG